MIDEGASSGERDGGSSDEVRNSVCGMEGNEFYKLSEVFFFFQAEDGIRGLVRSRGLGDVYKRQAIEIAFSVEEEIHLLGSKDFPIELITAKRGIVLDLSLIHI